MNNTVRTKVAHFFSQFKHQKFNKGEILIRADDNPLGIYFLREGLVKQYSISVKGEESIATIYKPHSFFPISWALNKSDNKYYFEAMKECEVFRAPVDAVIQFIKENPDVSFDLLSRVSKGLESLVDRMVYLMSESAYNRLIFELILNAKRFGNNSNKPNQNSFEIILSEKDLAAQTGLARETVSRELQNLKEKNLVQINKNRIVVDVDMLEKELAAY